MLRVEPRLTGLPGCSQPLTKRRGQRGVSGLQEKLVAESDERRRSGVCSGVGSVGGQRLSPRGRARGGDWHIPPSGVCVLYLTQVSPDTRSQSPDLPDPSRQGQPHVAYEPR